MVPKVLWRRVNELGILKDMSGEFNGITSDEFCNHFASVQSRSNLDRVDQDISAVDDSFSFQEVSVSDIKRAMFSVKSNATEMDNVRLLFIKIIWPFLSDSLLHVFNSVMSSSFNTSIWKKSLICPVPKVSRPFSISDYRPISLLPSIFKALEILIKEQMLDHLNSEILLNDVQEVS